MLQRILGECSEDINLVHKPHCFGLMGLTPAWEFVTLSEYMKSHDQDFILSVVLELPTCVLVMQTKGKKFSWPRMAILFSVQYLYFAHFHLTSIRHRVHPVLQRAVRQLHIAQLAS